MTEELDMKSVTQERCFSNVRRGWQWSDVGPGGRRQEVDFGREVW